MPNASPQHESVCIMVEYRLENTDLSRNELERSRTMETILRHTPRRRDWPMVRVRQRTRGKGTSVPAASL